MKNHLFFTHPDSSGAESSLSLRRKGDEGESMSIYLTNDIKFTTPWQV